jgi:cellulose biosynthesis protein BcsQ
LAKTGAPVKVIDLDQNGTLLRWGQKFAGQIENLTITTCAEAALGEQLLELVRSAEGYILLDLAGSLSTTMLQAAAIAHLTITPSQLSEPDIVEATKLYYQIRSVGEACGKAITHRILINAAPALAAGYQLHTLRQIEASSLERFQTMLGHRAAFAEQFYTGQPPHYAAHSRPAIAKAVAELDQLMAEIYAVLGQTVQTPVTVAA